MLNGSEDTAYALASCSADPKCIGVRNDCKGLKSPGVKCLETPKGSKKGNLIFGVQKHSKFAAYCVQKKGNM